MAHSTATSPGPGSPRARGAPASRATAGGRLDKTGEVGLCSLSLSLSRALLSALCSLLSLFAETRDNSTYSALHCCCATMRRGRRWQGRGAVPGGMVLSLAMIHPLLFCSASGAPRSNSALNGEAKLAATAEGLLQQEHTLEGAAHEPLPQSSAASATPEQVHISLAASGSMEEYAVTVAWATWPKAESQVVWGASAQQQDYIAYGSSTSECSKSRQHARPHVQV